MQHDFKSRLSFSWPRSPLDTAINVGDANYNPAVQLRLRHDLCRAAQSRPPRGSRCERDSGGFLDRYYAGGSPASGWRLFLREPFGPTVEVTTTNAQSPNRALTLTRFDRAAQEDSLRAAWNGQGASALVIGGSQIDVTRQANGELTLAVDMLVETPPTSPVLLGIGCVGETCRGAVDITEQLRNASGWTTVAVRLVLRRRGRASRSSDRAARAANRWSSASRHQRSASCAIARRRDVPAGRSLRARKRPLVSSDASPLGLVADIGGTSCRFALVQLGKTAVSAPVKFAVADYPDLQKAMHAYLQKEKRRSAKCSGR